MDIEAPPAGKSSAALPRAVAAVVAVKAVTLTLLLTAAWDTQWVSHLVQDVRTWKGFFEAAQDGQVPYVHFTKEYPVLGGVLYWAMSPFVRPDDLRQTVLVHGLFSMVADVVNTVLFFRIASAVAPRLALPATLFVVLNPTALVMTPVRFEGYVTAFALLGYAASRAGRETRAAIAWAVGCGIKWYPAFFLAAAEWRALVEDRRPARAVRVSLAFLLAFAAFNAPFALLAWQAGTFANWTDPYLFHVRRPLYWDTLLGVLQVWLGPLPWERHAGLWSAALMAAAVLVRPRLPLAHKAALVCIAAVLFNRIYSAQFNLWFYPFVVLAALAEPAARRRALVTLLLLLDAVNVFVFPVSFTPALAEMGGFFPYAARQNGGPWTVAFSAAIAVRAVLLAVLAGVLLRACGDAAQNTRRSCVRAG